MINYFYETCSTGEHKFSFQSIWEKDEHEYIIEECAKDFYENHDGWDVAWPIKFKLYDENENYIATYEINLEWEPDFQAQEIDE